MHGAIISYTCSKSRNTPLALSLTKKMIIQYKNNRFSTVMFNFCRKAYKENTKVYVCLSIYLYMYAYICVYIDVYIYIYMFENCVQEYRFHCYLNNCI